MDTTTTKTLAESIATAVTARSNCYRSGNHEWFRRHTETLETLAERLPSGSGIDSGTKINYAGCSDSCISLLVSYHNMDESGGYCDWTSFELTAVATFAGVSIYSVRYMGVSSRTEDEIERDKQTADYLADVYQFALTEEITQ